VAPPRLDQVNIVASDVSSSREFYSRLGIDFGEVNDPVWAVHHVSSEHDDHTPLDIDLDSTTFVHIWDEGWPGGPGLVLGFKVESRVAVDDLVDALEADGATVQQLPYDAFWGARYAVVSDPDGNAVGIMSPVDPARRSEAPAPA
jgi:catechol 2,3-dioxygenase-like lactoylglutathione lyase family enzyme